MLFSVQLLHGRGVSIAILSSFISFCYGFNLETRVPLIKTGRNGSYFGYSIAAHQIYHEGAEIERILLVGAPQDQNLQPNTNRSGALWKCPLTTHNNDCIQVITDGRKVKDQRRKNIDTTALLPPEDKEIKTDQWLGVTVKSQGSGKKVLVCAHRYTYDYWGRGHCYVLTQDLEIVAVHEPCNVQGGDSEKYGSCQTGTSGMFTDDDYVVIGSPGTFNWKGMITVFSPIGVNENSLGRDNVVYFGNGDQERIPNYGYLGMSITAGNFFNETANVFAVGAPRGNENGQVIFFKRKLLVANLKPHLILDGEQIASYFGHQVVTADLNGDKHPDLIVSAPFYFNPKTEEGGAVYVYMNDPTAHFDGAVPVKLTGKSESRFGFAVTSLGDLNKDGFDDIAVGAPYEGNGVVYIYLGSHDGLITKPSQIIKAETVSPEKKISTFGYSLSGGADLDQNEYPDLLIGAYEVDTVVLLRARPIIELTTSVKPHNNLTNIDPNVRNCLINNTNYIPCFSFKTCCTIHPSVKTNNTQQLLIKYQLEAETFEKQTSRIWFDDFNTKQNVITKELNIINNGSESCQLHIAYLKENVLDIQSPIKIKMSYELIHKEPKQLRGEKLLALDSYPILNQQQAETVFEATFLKDCGRNDICESKLIVSTNLKLEEIEPRYRMYQLILGEQRNLILKVNVDNVGESAYQTQLFVYHPKQISFNKVSNSSGGISEFVCYSMDIHVKCMLGNPLKQNHTANLQLEFDLADVGDTEKHMDFNVSVVTTSNDANKIKNENITLKILVVDRIVLDLSGISVPEEVPDMVNIQLKGESAIKYKEEIGSRVFHKYNIYNNGTWKVTNLKVEIEWPFQVANNRPQGKWLLYMEERPEISDGGSGRCDISLNDVNPLNLLNRKSESTVNYNQTGINSPAAGDKSELPEKLNVVSGSRSNRVKRDVEMVVPSETFTTKDGKKQKVVHMNCLLGTAKCHKFSCYLDLIESRQSATITIKSRLWDATLIEDYADVDQIKISSRAKMHIHSTPVAMGNYYSNEFQIVTNARVTIHGQQNAAPISFIYIVIAVLIGLLLFILLTLLLWKLGFFKRRRPDPTLSGNLEKHRLEDN